MNTGEAWACPACTLLNPLGVSSCNACGQPNPCKSAVLNLGVGGGSTGGLEIEAVIGQLWSEAALKVLLTLIGNAADHPADPKYRGPVKKGNARIRTLIVEPQGPSRVLREAGFVEDEECFRLPEPNLERLNQIRKLLQEQERRAEHQRIRSEVRERNAGPAPAAAAQPTSQFPAMRAKKRNWDPNLLAEMEVERRLKAEMQSSLPAAAPADAPRAAAQPQLSGDMLRLRVKLPLGGQIDLQVSRTTTLDAFRQLLARRTGIPLEHQKVRVGYPPQVLGSAADVALPDAGVGSGEVVHLENLHDSFLARLEERQSTMRELLETLPDCEDGGDMRSIFEQALIVLGVGLDETDFWGAVLPKMRELIAGGRDSPPEEVRAGLFLLQRLLYSRDPQERLALCVNCLPQHIDRLGQPLELRIDRERFFASTVAQVSGLGLEQLHWHPNVNFAGEDGEDAGGLTRGFFSEFAQQLVPEEPLLWQTTGRGALIPTADVLSAQAARAGFTTESLYRACGRVFGMAALNDCKLGRPLARSFVRLLVDDEPRSLAELQEELNHEAGDAAEDFRGRRDILEKPLADVGLAGALTLTRSLTNDVQGREVELVPGGAGIEVTDENKEQWLTELLRHKLVTSLRPAADAFREGLTDVFGGSGNACPLLCLLGADELIELWGGRGVARADVAQWRAVAEVNPVVSRQAEWLWIFLEEDCDDEQRGQVLRFATGSSRVGRNGVPSFSVEPGDGGDERLPTAMTCGNMLQLPRYTSRFALAQQMRTAAESCGSFQMH